MLGDPETERIKPAHHPADSETAVPKPPLRACVKVNTMQTSRPERQPPLFSLLLARVIQRLAARIAGDKAWIRR